VRCLFSCHPCCGTRHPQPVRSLPDLDLVDDDVDIIVREPISKGRVFRIAAGKERPAQTFTKPEVMQAVHVLHSSKTEQKNDHGLKVSKRSGTPFTDGLLTNEQIWWLTLG